MRAGGENVVLRLPSRACDIICCYAGVWSLHARHGQISQRSRTGQNQNVVCRAGWTRTLNLLPRVGVTVWGRVYWPCGWIRLWTTRCMRGADGDRTCTDAAAGSCCGRTCPARPECCSPTRALTGLSCSVALAGQNYTPTLSFF
jgi:hypothetical protein